MGKNETSFAFLPDSDWGKCYNDFLRRKRSESQHTFMRYTYVLTHFFSEPAKMPDMYTRADIEKFLYAGIRPLGPRAGQPPSASTMNSRLSVLKSFYEYAAGYETLRDGSVQPLMNRMSPTAGLHMVQPAQAYRTIAFVDFERLFAVIPTDTALGLKYRALFLMYFWTARRVSEILDLRWRDIQQTTLIDETGTRSGWIYHFRGKRRKSIDDVAELPQPAKEALDAYLAALGYKIESDDPIFGAGEKYATRKKKPLSSQTVWARLKRYATQAGIDPECITTHSFRHMAAQVRLQAGQNLLSISRLLRHTNVGTTHHYLQGLVSSVDDGAKKLEGKFGKFSKPDG